ncbi:hypothetical protein BU24DRAFT_420918 [Aaosphaeria arxii CBS 175.79]|uniref:Lytic polysaccharide monooxygenase n=1 Tax=Aaosphaeria arxii CBS 175.79 TaxID=1450172 RepID=A0A6A5XY19_9PLEO|nr:uncharacterized protein BU24DRAFT_420918 [Aaosphaeria arxii CBS 175.79]KAF2017856.1 hypothetical protein BU24DRAFT_420918 [Aaosphaeria arxii CBS 175.79]
MRGTTSIILALAAVARAAELSLKSREVTAGEEFEVEVVNATEAGSGYPGKKTTHLQFGISSMVYANWMCSLTEFVPAEDGTFKLTIPPEMGPFGSHYKLAYYGYEDPEEGTVGDSIIRGSNKFMLYLHGAKGQFVPAETVEQLKYNGLVGFWNADIPCKSYPCAQKCAQEEVPLDYAWNEGSTWMKCITECEGVIINHSRINQFPATSSTEVEVPQSLPTPTGSCTEDKLETKCGNDCCSENEYCFGYSQCVPLPLDIESLRSRLASKTSSPSSTRTGRPTGDHYPTGSATGSVNIAGTASSGTGSLPTETGAANGLGMDWAVVGAVAGVFGIAGL